MTRAERAGTTRLGPPGDALRKASAGHRSRSARRFASRRAPPLDRDTPNIRALGRGWIYFPRYFTSLCGGGEISRGRKALSTFIRTSPGLIRLSGTRAPGSAPARSFPRTRRREAKASLWRSGERESSLSPRFRGDERHEEMYPRPGMTSFANSSCIRSFLYIQ